MPPGTPPPPPGQPYRDNTYMAVGDRVPAHQLEKTVAEFLKVVSGGELDYA